MRRLNRAGVFGHRVEVVIAAGLPLLAALACAIAWLF
jgi:hypothetical protein